MPKISEGFVKVVLFLKEKNQKNFGAKLRFAFLRPEQLLNQKRAKRSLGFLR